MNYLVYKHTSPSGKSYIGITKNLTERNKTHKQTTSCNAFAAAIKKYGWDNFTHEILVEGLTLEEANAMEKQLITEHNTLTPYGYNLRGGGEGGGAQSEESREKIRQARKANPISPEQQKRMAVARTGRKLSPELRAKLSAIAKERNRVKNFTKNKERLGPTDESKS